MREFHRDVILRNAEGRQHAGGGERGTRFIAWRGAPRISREMCLEQEKGEQLARRTFSTLVLFKSPVQTLLLSHFWPTSSSSLGPIDCTKCWRTFLCGQACEASNACAYSRDQVRSDPTSFWFAVACHWQVGQVGCCRDSFSFVSCLCRWTCGRCNSKVVVLKILSMPRVAKCHTDVVLPLCSMTMHARMQVHW